ncbi:hypothetical protein HMPREF0322_00390 [Desulfitobacterium hafniense DP7]|uniref:Baseplate protein J-like barrel domain-containing protein n=1 Tax=Desulfitobacterium hafniense DP7 TaxID=537010 RepID=G9XHG5_DESHA|nr:baseplate J/gp47 family protein [Desulfitobacterium hafniense]EHL08967.1 hypothetical protein HMPREF0322_00390 [Desulfitobacterium hafniense DP7]
MAYFAPYVDETGLHIPTYTDIVTDLVDSAKNIFGQDVYLEPDSQDYQWISIVALKISDAFQAVQMAYNARSPVTAIGTGLDAVVKLNGIKRKPSNILDAYSRCEVQLSGTPGTAINSGVVQDMGGYKWSLPSSVIIGPGGTVSATATCAVKGQILANSGDINTIVTPIYGWESVTNLVAAIPGVEIETDPELKARQSISTAQPSMAIMEGLRGAIVEVPGVTRHKVYENDTNMVDALGLPAHSITCIIEGGNDAHLGAVIYAKKTPGCYTNGDVVVNHIDRYDQIVPIRFYRPEYKEIQVEVTVKQLRGYTSSHTEAIIASVSNFLDSGQIGDDLPISSLWWAALSKAGDMSSPAFSITSLKACISGGTLGTNDIPIDFNEVTKGNPDLIEVVFDA